jgi:hypothetical protein
MGNVKRSTPGSSSSDPLLARLVAEDRKIEKRQDSAMLALMEHRWKAVNEHGFSMRADSRALGHKQPSSVRKYVRGWEIWESRSERSGALTPVDALELANMSPEQGEATSIVASLRGISIAQAGKDAGYRRQSGRVRQEITEDANQLVAAGSSNGDARRRAAARVAHREMIRINKNDSEPEPTAIDLGADDFDPSEQWADTLVIGVNRKARELSKHVQAWGFVLGSMPSREALEYLEEGEQLIADLRAAMQERVQDEEMS